MDLGHPYGLFTACFLICIMEFQVQAHVQVHGPVTNDMMWPTTHPGCPVAYQNVSGVPGIAPKFFFHNSDTKNQSAMFESINIKIPCTRDTALNLSMCADSSTNTKRERFLMACVTCPVSHVMCQVLGVKCRQLRITCHLSLTTTATATEHPH